MKCNRSLCPLDGDDDDDDASFPSSSSSQVGGTNCRVAREGGSFIKLVGTVPDGKILGGDRGEDPKPESSLSSLYYDKTLDHWLIRKCPWNFLLTFIETIAKISEFETWKELIVKKGFWLACVWIFDLCVLIKKDRQKGSLLRKKRAPSFIRL